MGAANARAARAGARRQFGIRSSALGALCSPRGAVRDIRAACDTGDIESVCAARLAAIQGLTTSRLGSSQGMIFFWFPPIPSRLADCLQNLRLGKTVVDPKAWAEWVEEQGHLHVARRVWKSVVGIRRTHSCHLLTRTPRLDIMLLPRDVPTSATPSFLFTPLVP